jgi:hypothetical protein
MQTRSLLPDEIPFEGPIALERALFCLDCEVIFTDLASCPSCCGKIVWPLAKWLSPAQPDLTPKSMPAGCSPTLNGGADACRAVA